MPWYVETRLIYYRTDLAEKAGVTPSRPTWDDLKAFAKAHAGQGAAPSAGIYLQPGGQGSWQTFMPFVWQNGAELIDGDKFTFDTAADAGGARLLPVLLHREDLADASSPPGALETASSRASIGAFVSGPWHMGILRDQGGAEFEGK